MPRDWAKVEKKTRERTLVSELARNSISHLLVLRAQFCHQARSEASTTQSGEGYPRNPLPVLGLS